MMLPTWPNERDLACYAEFTKINFNQELAAGQLWIDIGSITGKTLSGMLAKHVECYCEVSPAPPTVIVVSSA